MSSWLSPIAPGRVPTHPDADDWEGVKASMKSHSQVSSVPMRRFPVGCGLCLGAVLALMAACSPHPGESSAPGAGQNSADSVPVTVATVARRDVPVELRAIGRVQAYATVAIKPRVEGQLVKAHFSEGESVRKGELLFTVDPRPLEAALRQAQANLARDRAELGNANVEVRRLRRLLADGFVSQDEYDQADTRARALQATVKADEAAVERAELDLGYCSIRSPVDGRIGRVLINEGNVFKANEATLAVVNQIRPIYVAFSVAEQFLPQIQERARATTLTIAAWASGADGPVSGKLDFIDNAVDTTTGTVMLKGLFENEDEVLWPGQFVDVALTLAVERNAVVVPSQAVQTGQEGQYVFVVTPDAVAEIRLVKVGRAAGSDTLVEKGLEPGESVVIDGQVRLAPGVRVQPRTGLAVSSLSTPPAEEH